MSQLKGSALRAALLLARPDVKPLTLPEGYPAVFVRRLDVKGVNFEVTQYRAHRIKLAQEQGIELDLDDELILQSQLKQVMDPYSLARRIAFRVCDPDGVLLFDSTNDADLDAINGLDEGMLDALRAEIDKVNAAKNSVPGDASSSS
ncbi:hypothetical protein [Silvimonas sp.]|uniref:hypothetical protein n=1 Tax=Silvimonas sp. TaxID=2650811 RepID=UPI00284A99E2|nr:hypothetical protein [Silvimonas sp.]MDR3427941.1 hypothetical protein [Silvimonas sp.]